MYLVESVSVHLQSYGCDFLEEEFEIILAIQTGISADSDMCLVQLHKSSLKIIMYLFTEKLYR